MKAIPSKLNNEVYFTELNVNITDKVLSGQTKFFTDRREAAKYAEGKRSYVFEVFNKTSLIGFGVTN